MSRLFPSAAAGLALVFATSVSAQNVPTNIVIDTVISSGLSAPIDFCFTPDGRTLIANRAGSVSVYAGTSPSTVGSVPSVQSGGERGLLSIEADPDFATNGYIYVYYSSSQDTFLKLDRYTCTGDLANPASTNLSFSSASRRAILTTLPDSQFNHNGGSARFGPDGMLYLSIGDDAINCSAQSLTSKRGCLLRMNVAALTSAPSTSEASYSLIDPGDNPNSSSNGFDQLVIANGLRNPFRMEIDQVTGNCYIGDVGLGTAEEYSEYVYNPGALTLVNFGWPWREGFNGGPSNCGGGQPAGLVNPIAAVTSGNWNSIMGGMRYRNQGGQFDLGSSYEGDAFYLDFFSGELRRITLVGSTWQAAPSVPGQSGLNWGTGFQRVTSMRQGPDGAIYYCQNTSTSPSSGGTLERLRQLGPVDSVVAVSGDDQVGISGEVFAQPIVARVLDSNGVAIPGGTINFSVTGGSTLSTTNPVIADANGEAQTIVTASATTGGALTVTAATPGSPNTASFGLFARRLNAVKVAGPTTTLIVLSATNTTTAQPAQIPYVVLMSYPGSPTLPSPIGDICTDPGYALTLVLEDGTGGFGGASFSGTGAIGTPNKTWLYQNVPNFLVQGQLMSFQAIGFDPVTGWFRTNCELEQF
ncbi:MAG: PQQ-dependent sugar dehydrogenase [Planctomycetota bacterium]